MNFEQYLKNSRVKLVNPPYSNAGANFISYPLGLLNIASHFENKNCEIVDLALEFQIKQTKIGENEIDQMVADLVKSKPDCIAFSIQCFTTPVALIIGKKIKTLLPECYLVFGGHNAKLIGGELKNFFPWIDEVYSEGLLLTTFPEKLNFDKIPSIQKYIQYSNQPAALVEISRGCPYSCEFCSIPLTFGRKVQYRNIEDIVSEIRFLIGQGYEEIHFVDDVFTLNKIFIRKLLEHIKELKVAWTAMTRVDLVDEDLIKLMSQSGCYSILYGVESGDKTMLTEINKKARYPDMVEFINWHIKNSIKPTLYFIINLPNDTRESIAKTLDMAARISYFDRGSCVIQLPRIVPGTETSKKSRLKGLNEGYKYNNVLKNTFIESYREPYNLISNFPLLFSTFYYDEPVLDITTAKLISAVFTEILKFYPITIIYLVELNRIFDFINYVNFTSDIRFSCWHQLSRYASTEKLPNVKILADFEFWMSAEDCSLEFSTNIDLDEIEFSIRRYLPVQKCLINSLKVYFKQTI